MRGLFVTIFFMILIIGACGTMMKSGYVVQMDYANNQPVAVLDGATGKRVPLTLEDLRSRGETYEIMYVAPKMMGN